VQDEGQWVNDEGAGPEDDPNGKEHPAKLSFEGCNAHRKTNGDEEHGVGENQIKCTGACATSWPPLLVPAHATLATHIRGAMGKFGVIMRPDGTHQLTYQGKALYRYQGDTKPGEALCQASDGWYVFSAH